MRSWIKDLLIITLLAGLLFGMNLGKSPLIAPDGGRYAEIPREMVVTKDYLTPHLNGIKYFEKPPLFYWLQAASIKVFGVNELAASLVNALMALALTVVIYIVTRKLYSRLSAFLASAVFATSGLVFALSRAITLDIALTFFLSSAFLWFLLAVNLPLGKGRSASLWFSYLLVGLAVMTKGLVGIIFPGILFLIWITLFHEWKNLKNYQLISGLIIFLLVTLPWHILVQLKNPEFFRFYFIDQHFLRYFTDYAKRTQEWWFFPTLLLSGLYPWLGFFPSAFIYHLPKKLIAWQQNKNAIFLFLWIVIIYTFYSFSQSKLIPYILPIFPPIAIMIGTYLANFWPDKKSKPISYGFYTITIVNLILAIAAMSTLSILNFDQQAITKENLLIISAITLFSAIITNLLYRKRGVALGLVTLIGSTVVLWLYLNPIITTINRQSVKPLATIILEKLKPSDEVICYGDYYQDLPFYLQRTVTVAEFKGELEFGMKHQDSSSWMINQNSFWQRWNSPRTIYLIVDVDKYRALQPVAPDKMRIIAKYLDTLLVTNSKQ